MPFLQLLLSKLLERGEKIDLGTHYRNSEHIHLHVITRIRVFELATLYRTSIERKFIVAFKLLSYSIICGLLSIDHCISWGGPCAVFKDRLLFLSVLTSLLGWCR